MPATVLGRLAWHYLVNGGWQKVADEYVFDTRILTNHQPYFAAYIKVKDLLKFTDRLELVQDEWGYLLLWATLGIAAVFAFTLVLFPLIFGWRTIFSRYPGKSGTMVYFLCLGLGYIIVEVGMISHFILALSNATVSASVLITGMLVFSGFGSFVSERFLDRARSVMPKIFLAIFVILTLYAFTIDYALDWIGTLPYALRIVLCLLLLMPPAFLMGFPMPTAMTTLGRLGKDHMFLWAWGINGCFSVIGAALVPIVATSFGLPAVVLVGAIAYLVALPAFFSVLMPLVPGKERAASGSREAAGAAAGGPADADGCARANDKADQPRSRPPKPAADAAAHRPAAAQGGEDAARRLQRLGLPLSQHRSRAARSRSSTRSDGTQARPHQPARRRLLGGHRPTATAARCSICRPATIRSGPALIVLYLHGQGATLERDVMARQAVPRQIAESGQNVALVAPQLALDAADSSAGNFWKPGHFAAYIDEAAERLMRLYGDRARRPAFQRSAPVVIVAYSGGYLSAAYALDRGGAAHRIKGVILMDALYGDEDKFAAWVAARRRQAFLLSAYTEFDQGRERDPARAFWTSGACPTPRRLPPALNPGTVRLSCRAVGLDMHGDFVTRAWRPDPLKACAGHDSRLRAGS